METLKGSVKKSFFENTHIEKDIFIILCELTLFVIINSMDVADATWIWNKWLIGLSAHLPQK